MDSIFPNNWFSLKWFNIFELFNYEWENQSILLLTLLIPLILIINYFINKNNFIEVSIPSSDLKKYRFSFLRLIPNTIFLLSVIFIIISLGRPQKSNEKVEKWSEGIDIMLVVDISESMQIEDFKPNRLESAKNVAKEFINGRFQDRIGLVVFSGESYSRCPLTTDYILLNEYVDEISFDKFPSSYKLDSSIEDSPTIESSPTIEPPPIIEPPFPDLKL